MSGTQRSEHIVRPPALYPNATIGLIAPASPPLPAHQVQEGIQQLKRRGFRIKQLRTALPATGYLAGSDTERLWELNTFLRDPEVDALFCLRGGYGTLRILSGVDYTAARTNPKLLIGYSDITALQLALLKQAGLPSLSGPMVAVDWPHLSPASERSFWQLARGEAPLELQGPDGEPLIPVYPGTAEGLLIGGNLSLITRLIGTPFLPNLQGALLFVEDVGEKPYQVDAQLAHLLLAGILPQLGGLIFGAFTESDPPRDRPSWTIEEVIADYAKKLRIPVARGLVYGHIPEKVTMPIGARALLEVTGEHAHLTVLEPVVNPLQPT